MPDSAVFCGALLLALAAASLLALVLGALAAAWLAMARFAWRRALVAVLGAFAAVPPGLAVGLAVVVVAPHWGGDDMLTAAWALAAWALLAAPLALLLTHGALAAGWARHGRGLQSAGASRRQALGPLLASQRRTLTAAWLAVLARGLGELAAALALGLLPVAVTPLLPLGLAVVLAGVAVWRHKKEALF